jgi:hypothetical protein
MWSSRSARKSVSETPATRGAENTKMPLRRCITPITFCTGKNRSAIIPRKNGETMEPIGLAI